jgi:hypothetical protein
VSTGAYRAGDGAAAVTVELAGEHACALLSLLVDPSTGTLRAADATVLQPPPTTPAPPSYTPTSHAPENVQNGPE